jgi:glycosyltransferase involved in cell wall biosynthesis
MKKMLFWGDSPTVTTGFGNVSKNILSSLTDYFVTVLGINDRGGWKDPKIYPYPIYPTHYFPQDDEYGAIRLIRTFQGKDPEITMSVPDTFFVNIDFFVFQTIKINNVPLLDLLAQVIPKETKKIIYTPIDCDVIHDDWKSSLEFFDTIIVPTYYGRRVLRSYGIKSEVIYYPLDTENFHKKSLDDKPKNKFVIGYVGRNQWRKDLARLIHIFAKFKETHEDAYLYIHTQPQDRNQQGWDLFRLADQYGMRHGVDYYFPTDIDDNKGKERTKMIDVYNYFDVFLSTSTGEGYGLPYAEASLCEVPLLIPDNSVSQDFKDVASIYTSTDTHSFGWIDGNRIRPLGDVDSALEHLEKIYQNRKEYATKAQKAREHFLQFNNAYFRKKIVNHLQ